jgi:tetratricopeptide (TPR) repeat protein
MNKSLAPLIISFAVIILLTFIIINTKPRESAIELQTNGTAPTISLNKISKTQFRHKAPMTRKQRDSYIPDTEKFLEDAKNFLSNGKEDEAENTLRTLLIFEPDNPQALSLLAGIFYYSQRYAEAEVIFRRQIKLNPDNDSLYNHLGSALARQGKMKKAIAMTLKAAEINPKSPDVQINLSSMYASEGDVESCIKHFLLAYQLIGYRILPFSYDPAFDKVRSSPEFQEIISRAKNDMGTNLKSNKIPGKSVNSDQQSIIGNQ